MNTPISILLGQAPTLARDALRALLNAEADLAVVAEADDPPAVRALVQQHHPRVLVTESVLGGRSWLPMLLRMRQEADAPAIVLLASDEPASAAAGGPASTVGLAKVHRTATLDPGDLFRAIRQAALGEPVPTGGPAPELRPRTALLPALDSRGSQAGTHALTGREQEVLDLIADGLQSRQIALRLGISVQTVATHRSHLMQKLDLHSVVALTRFVVGRRRLACLG